VDGASGALEWFGSRDRLAIWTFSSPRSRSQIIDPAARSVLSGKRSDVEPSGDIPRFRGSKGLKRRLQGLVFAASGGTPLNLAIYYGVRALRRGWQPGINVLVVLTDGYDDMESRLHGAPLDEARLNRLLSKGSQAPVHVLLTAADYDVRCDALLADLTAVTYDPDRDCFPVGVDSDLSTTFEHVHQRLLELARR
jgi:hypothetical protein